MRYIRSKTIRVLEKRSTFLKKRIQDHPDCVLSFDVEESRALDEAVEALKIIKRQQMEGYHG